MNYSDVTATEERWTLEALTELMEKEENSEGVKQCQIVKLVAEKKSAEEDYPYEPSQLQPNVTRKLKILIKKGHVILKDSKKYVLATEVTRKEQIKNVILTSIHFPRRDIFKISNTTFLVDVGYDQIQEAARLFKEYFSIDEVYFDIIDIKDRLMILLTGETEKRKTAYRELKAIVREGYDADKASKKAMKKKLLRKDK